jgi:adenylate cyclase
MNPSLALADVSRNRHPRPLTGDRKFSPELIRMNAPVPTPCLLLALVQGADRLEAKLGKAEASYAVERCLNRMSRCAEAHARDALESRQDSLQARFEDAEAALMAAREMRERVSALPPVSGIKLGLRVGLVLMSEHAGVLEDARQGARLLAEAAEADAISVSGAFGEALPALARRLLDGFVEEPAPLAAPQAAETPRALEPHGSGEVLTRPVPMQLYQPEVPIQQVQPVRPVQPTVAVAPARQLRVSHRGKSWVIDASHPALLFGRETANDIVVHDPRVSRQHARIEWRNDQFYLIDSSTNGTYLLDDQSPERCIKQNEHVLGEKGHIGCGFSVADNMSEAVAFALA